MNVNSFDTQDTIGYVNKNKTRNCQLDASKNYDDKMAKIYVRLDPKLKTEFMDLCNNIGVSMNEEIVGLIEADVRSF